MLTAFLSAVVVVATPGLIVAFLALFFLDHVGGAVMLTFGSATAIGAGLISGLVAAFAHRVDGSFSTRHTWLSFAPLAALSLSVFPAQILVASGRVSVSAFAAAWLMLSIAVYAATLLRSRHRDAQPGIARDRVSAGVRKPSRDP